LEALGKITVRFLSQLRKGGALKYAFQAIQGMYLMIMAAICVGFACFGTRRFHQPCHDMVKRRSGSICGQDAGEQCRKTS
jgi:hypothetical protein